MLLIPTTRQDDLTIGKIVALGLQKVIKEIPEEGKEPGG